jgi:hypothetical protein
MDNITFNITKPLSGYDVLTLHAVLSIIVDMTSLHIIHVSNYTIVDTMTLSNANLYVVLARSSSYFRVWQDGADFLLSWVRIFVSKHYGRS